MDKTNTLLWLLLSVTVMLLSCQEEAAQCEFTSECETGQICQDRQCTEGCQGDRDCASDQVCAQGQCGPAEVLCRADDDCRFGLVCRQGLCEEVAGRCNQNGDCPSGQVCDADSLLCIDADTGRTCAGLGDCFALEDCVEGLCVPRSDDPDPEPECRRDQDCPDGQQCANQRCEAECLRNSDCPSGQACQAGQCQAECIDDRDCPGGQQCRAGRCEAECTADRDCPGGQQCRAGQCSAECVEDRDCPGDQQCRAGQCEAECVVDRDCDAPDICIQNSCQPECLDDRDCSGGQQCIEGACGSNPNDNTYSGNFLITAVEPFATCGQYLTINYDPRLVTLNHQGRSFTMIFSESVYEGVITNGSFEASWSGDQGITEACGQLQSANTFRASFTDPDFFEGTLSAQFFGVGLVNCGCTTSWRVRGLRQ